MCLKFFHIGNRSKKLSDTNVCAHTSKKASKKVEVLKELKQTS